MTATVTRGVARGARVGLLVNPKAGGVGPEGPLAVRNLLEAHGMVIAVTHDGPEDLATLLALRRQLDLVVVLGGDGTAGAAAALFANQEAPPLAILPGGTMNMLPRALVGERPWPEALDALLTQGVVRRLPGGRANGRPFFVAAMFGAPTLMARAREAARHGRFLQAITRANLGFRRMLSSPIRVRAEGFTASRAEAVGVLTPAFEAQLGEARAPLEWVRLDAAGVGDLARVSWKAARGEWRADPAVELTRAHEGRVVSRGLIPATIDGEPTMFLSRVRIETLERGPRVLALP